MIPGLAPSLSISFLILLVPLLSRAAWAKPVEQRAYYLSTEPICGGAHVRDANTPSTDCDRAVHSIAAGLPRTSVRIIWGVPTRDFPIFSLNDPIYLRRFTETVPRQWHPAGSRCRISVRYKDGVDPGHYIRLDRASVQRVAAAVSSRCVERGHRTKGITDIYHKHDSPALLSVEVEIFREAPEMVDPEVVGWAMSAEKPASSSLSDEAWERERLALLSRYYHSYRNESRWYP